MSEEAVNNDELDSVIQELQKIIGPQLHEIIHTCPLEDDATIRRRLFAYMLTMTMERARGRTMEVSMEVMLSLLCEVYCWREKYGSIRPTIH